MVYLILIAAYFAILFAVSAFTKGKGDNATFFSANRSSSWYMVAFGMIGTSLSGLTFISVPGQVGAQKFHYFAVVLGYILGYTAIATILLPLYYRLNLVSIYGYLEKRLGRAAFKTGASFFLLSRTLGSGARFFLALSVLQLAVFDPLGVPFWVSVLIGLALIWVYTFQGGVKTIIVTDTLQTACMLGCLLLSLFLIAGELSQPLPALFSNVLKAPTFEIFDQNPNSPQFWVKQVLSGAFIAIVMTGLDQDMMQKNLTCRSLKDAQLNMFSFTAILVVVNFLFLVLGGALLLLAQAKNIPLPPRPDDIFPTIALQHLGTAAQIVFVLGIIAATYASTDSALTALTTSFSLDILEIQQAPPARAAQTRNWVHIGATLAMFVVVLIFRQSTSGSLLGVVFKLAGYTYGPLLGMFSFGMLTRRTLHPSWIAPVICIASPLICLAAEFYTTQHPAGYQFGFELLLLNAALVFSGLFLFSRQAESTAIPV
jgi:Na+/proline symporter